MKEKNLIQKLKELNDKVLFIKRQELQLKFQSCLTKSKEVLVLS